MSLATRCTSCHTAFRVVQDQLKVSEGWVRCGRCESVFNALEELFDLGNDDAARREILTSTPTPASPGDSAFERTRRVPRTEEHPASADAVKAVAPSAVDEAAASDEEAGADEAAGFAPSSSLDDLLADPIDAHIFRNRRGADGDRLAVAKVRERDRNEFSDARFDSDLFSDPAEADDATPGEAMTTGAGDLPLESSGGPHQPDFLRRAERRARWRSGPVRGAVAVVAIAAAVVFGLQFADHFRDRIAAEWPITAPALSAWCRAAGCSLQAPRQVDAITVESTALSRAIGREGYVLAVTLRSRARHALSLPWVDLALTDANGRLVARRALSPRDFGAASTLPASAEVPLQLTLDAGATRVAGYTVEIFYP